jgi:hypothetical protein
MTIRRGIAIPVTASNMWNPNEIAIIDLAAMKVLTGHFLVVGQACQT